MSTNNTSTTVAPTAAAPAKQKDPYKGYNIALYVGSAMIVIAALFFAGSASKSLIAPTLMTLSLVMYLAGLVIFNKVSYLKPVGKALNYTGLVMTLFWISAFDSLGMNSAASTLLSFTIFTVLSYISAFVFTEAALGYVSYIATFATFFAAGANFTYGATGMYLSCLLSLIFSFIIAALWYNRVTWLPIAFRRATRALSRITTPLLVVFVFLGCISEPERYPMLLTVTFLISLLQFIYGYMRDHSANKILAIRVLAQGFIFVLVSDILALTNASEKTASFALGLILFATSAIQLAYSLFVGRPKHAIASNENLLTVASVIALLVSTAFFGSLTGSQQSVIRIVSYAIVSGFGVGLMLKYNKAAWLLVPLCALLIIPLELGFAIADPNWTAWTFMGVYALVAIIITGIYATVHKFKDQQKEAFAVCFSTTLVALAIVFGICFSKEASVLGWFIVAIISLAQIYIRNEKKYYWVPIYAAALCAYSLSNTIFGNVMNHHAVFGPSNQMLDLIRSVVGIHILAIAPLSVNLLLEKGKTKPISAMVAYYALSTVFIFDALICRIGFDSISLALVFLLEQVIFMVYGLIKHGNWLTTSSIVYLFIVVFYMSTGYGYLWLFVVGVALIGGVIAKLVHTRAKDSTNAASQPATPKTVPSAEKPALKAAPTAHIVTESTKPAAKSAETPQQSSRPTRLGGKPHSAKYN